VLPTADASEQLVRPNRAVCSNNDSGPVSNDELSEPRQRDSPTPPSSDSRTARGGRIILVKRHGPFVRSRHRVPATVRDMGLNEYLPPESHRPGRNPAFAAVQDRIAFRSMALGRPTGPRQFGPSRTRAAAPAGWISAPSPRPRRPLAADLRGEGTGPPERVGASASLRRPRATAPCSFLAWDLRPPPPPLSAPASLRRPRATAPCSFLAWDLRPPPPPLSARAGRSGSPVRWRE